MPEPAIIVVGASAGGVEALLALAAVLPPDLPAAVFIALHTAARSSALPRLLSGRGPLPAVPAADGASVELGRIYVAPGDRQLVVARGHMHVVHGPSEHGFRPAFDLLFRSAAQAYGAQVIGVILSGWLDDGTAGLLAVKRHGRKASGHGPQWRAAMIEMGLEPKVSHNYPVQRNSKQQKVVYRCLKCGSRLDRARRLPRRRKYVHARCGGALKLEAVERFEAA